MSFGAQEPCTKRNRDREHLELRRSQREQPGLAMRQKNETGELAHSHPNYVVYSGVCANCSGAPINAILDGKMSILLTDHRRLRHRPRHVLWLIPQSAPAVYLVSRLQISEERDQRLCRASGGEPEESAISSRTSNHRLVWLMELFGNLKDFIPEAEGMENSPEVL